MDSTSTVHPPLPEGWFYPDADEAQRLFTEFHLELPPGHLLDSEPVEVFAWRRGASDDVLFRHRDAPEHFTVIHLSWLGRTEINAQHPTVEFGGSFAGFLAEEKRLYGIVPPET